MRALINIAFVLVSWIVTNLSSADEPYSYELFTTLEFKGQKVSGVVKEDDLGKLYRLELIPSKFTFRNEKGEIVPTSCDTYLEALNNGYSPSSENEIGHNRYPSFTCLTLNALKNSKKALYSYVDRMIPQMDQLPVAIFIPASNEEAEKLLSDSQNSYTVQDYCRDNKIQCSKSHQEMTIQESDGYMKYELVAIGDFDQDGLEDILLHYEENYGSWIAHGFSLVSKSINNQMIYNVRNVYGSCFLERDRYSCSETREWEPN